MFVSTDVTQTFMPASRKRKNGLHYYPFVFCYCIFYVVTVLCWLLVFKHKHSISIDPGIPEIEMKTETETETEIETEKEREGRTWREISSYHDCGSSFVCFPYENEKENESEHVFT